VQGVAQQRDRPGDDDHDELQQGGDAQADEADDQGPASGAVGFQRIVDLIGGVV